MPQPLAGLHVLVVDDEPLIAAMVEDLLQELGCAFCQSVCTSQSALDAIETLTPDLVVLDLALNRGEPDLGLADTLMVKGIPFIFVSGYSADMVPKRYGKRPFVAKPFSTDELEAAVSSAVVIEGKAVRDPQRSNTVN